LQLITEYTIFALNFRENSSPKRQKLTLVRNEIFDKVNALMFIMQIKTSIFANNFAHKFITI